MQPKENAKIRKANTNFSQVFDSRNRRVRGLWIRNGTFYVQMRVEDRDHPVRVELHDAQTVPQAQQAMQVLKKKRDDGELDLEKSHGVPKFSEVADSYLKELRDLESKRPDTIKRESSCIQSLKSFLGDRTVTKITMSDAYAYAKWRKDHPARVGWESISGRQIDLDIIALRHVLKKSVRDGHRKSNPIVKWESLADDPKEVRLVSTEELERMRAKAPDVLHNGGAQFANYLAVLASSGGREQETLGLKWSISVDWNNKRLGFGQAARAKFGKTRWIPFNPALEKILTEMNAVRKPDNDLLFPSRIGGGEMTSYRKSLEHVKSACKVSDFGFHHLRHYFISHAIMSGVDPKTLSEWVGHEDIKLIMSIYTHLQNKHSIEQAAKVKFGD